MNNPSIIELSLFATAWAVGVYAFNCILSRQIRKIAVKPALLYMSMMAMLGVVGEVAIDSFYTHMFHKPLWNYTIYPIHNAYTSKYAVFLWAIYGFHLYLLHSRRRKGKEKTIKQHALSFCLEAVILEALVNLTFKFSFGKYIYYYFPSDLWHLTSIQTLPFYFGAGLIIFYAVKAFSKNPPFYSAMCGSLAFVFVFLA